MISGVSLSAGVALGYAWWKQAQRPVGLQADRAAPEVLFDGSGVHCPVTAHLSFSWWHSRSAAWRKSKTFTQRALDMSFVAWAYDPFRETITRALNGLDRKVEAAMA